MSCLLDTNAYSAICYEQSVEVREIIQEAHFIYVSPVVVVELLSGLKR